MNVLIIDDNVELCKLIEMKLHKDGRFKVLGFSHNGNEAIEDIVSKKPDIVLLDILLPERDGISVLEEINSKNLVKRPVFIALTAVGQENITKRIFDLGASYVILKPFNMELLLKRMLEQFNSRGKIVESENFVEHKKTVDKKEYVSDILQKIGIPINLKGYSYLKVAINLSLEDEKLLESITKLLYPAIARECGTTPSRVERDIRHSLEVSWSKGSGQYYYEFIGYKDPNNAKPTNGAFISSIVEKSRQYLK